MERPTWDEYYMDMARKASTRSSVETTQVGAVLVSPNANTVVSTGYNGRVAGAVHKRVDEGDEEKECHAEMNAIAFAARAGIATLGSILYTTHTPCVSCAKLIAQAGITRVVTLENKPLNKDLDKFYGDGLSVLLEGNVKITYMVED